MVLRSRRLLGAPRIRLSDNSRLDFLEVSWSIVADPSGLLVNGNKQYCMLQFERFQLSRSP